MFLDSVPLEKLIWKNIDTYQVLDTNIVQGGENTRKEWNTFSKQFLRRLFVKCSFWRDRLFLYDLDLAIIVYPVKIYIWSKWHNKDLLPLCWRNPRISLITLLNDI